MIKWIVIGILGLIILGYLGFDIRKAIESPATQSNIGYIKEVTVYVWTKYLAKPISFLWKDIFVKYIWNIMIDKLKSENSELDKKDGDEDKMKTVLNSNHYFEMITV